MGVDDSIGHVTGVDDSLGHVTGVDNPLGHVTGVVDSLGHVTCVDNLLGHVTGVVMDKVDKGNQEIAEIKTWILRNVEVLSHRQKQAKR